MDTLSTAEGAPCGTSFGELLVGSRATGRTGLPLKGAEHVRLTCTWFET